MFVALLCVPASALTGPAQVTVEPGATFDPGQGFLDASEATALGDGNTLFAYSALNGTRGDLYSAVLGPDGASTSAPLLVAAGQPTLSTVSVGLLDHGAAAIVWVSATGPSLAVWAAGQITSTTPLPTSGLTASDCAVSKGPGPLAVLCSLIETPLPNGDIQEVYLYRVDGNGSLTSGPLLVSPRDDISAVVDAVELDFEHNAWVSYREGYDFPSERQAYLVSVALNGTVSSPPIPITGRFDQGEQVDIMRDPSGQPEVIVASAWNDPSTSNGQVEVSRYRAGSNSALETLRMTVVAAPLRGLLVAPRGVGGQDLLLIEWVNEFPPADSSPAAVQVASFAAAYGNLSLAMAPAVGHSTTEFPVRLVRGTGNLLTGSFTTTTGLVRVSWPVESSPRPAPPPPSGKFEEWLILALVVGAVSTGAALPFAMANDRVRWAASLLLGPLYGLVRRERAMIDNIRRGAILQVIKEAPGIRYRDLSRRTEIALGALTHHLQVLEAYGFIERRTTRQAVQFFLAGENPIKEEPFVELRTRILDTVREKPGISHSELARRVGVKWTTLLYHVELLHGDGKLSMRRRRSRRRYWPR